MEPNKAYNIVQLNNSTTTEAVYDTCEPPEQKPGGKRSSHTAVQGSVNMPSDQNKRRFIMFVSMHSILVLLLAMALAGLVLRTTNDTAQTDTLNKILTAIHNTSNHISVGESTPSTLSADILETILSAVQNISNYIDNRGFTPSTPSTDILNRVLSAVQNISDHIEDLQASLEEEISSTTGETTSPTIPSTESAPTPPSHICGEAEWRRVAFINMSDPNQGCPQGLNETSYAIRTCGRAHSGPFACSSVTFPVSGGHPYRQVCGMARGYRRGDNLGVRGYHHSHYGINGSYIDGLSLTHGPPRTHIWSFISGLFNGTIHEIGNAPARCPGPCNPGNIFGSPPFVGNDYFCESASGTNNWGGPWNQFYSEKPLWDGHGCEGHVNMCCQFNNPPWFKKTLPNPTSDDIEMRLCIERHSLYADLAVELLELYVN